jgi:WD40 repeat protein
MATAVVIGIVLAWPRPPRRVAILPEPGEVVTLAFSPDGTLLAGGSRRARGHGRTGDWMGEFVVWEVETQEERFRITLEQWANCVAFSPDGAALAVACGCYNDAPGADWGYREVPGEVRIYDPQTGKLKKALAHKHAVCAAAFSPDGKMLVTGGGNRVKDTKTGEWVAVAEVHVWDARSWERVGALEGLSVRVEALTFSRDGSTLAVGAGRSVVLYAPPERVPRQSWEVLRASHRVTSLALSPDGSLLVVSGDDKAGVVIWDTQLGRPKQTKVPKQERRKDVSTCLSPDGKTLVTIGHEVEDHPDALPVIYDLPSGKKLAAWTEPGMVVGQAISPDGKLLATSHAWERGSIKIWSVPTR